MCFSAFSPGTLIRTHMKQVTYSEPAGVAALALSSHVGNVQWYRNPPKRLTEDRHRRESSRTRFFELRPGRRLGS
jgi:hypothetical protein